MKAAPDKTEATGSAAVATTGPFVNADGAVVFGSGVDTLTLGGRRIATAPWGVREPVAALDLLRGARNVRSYGGAEVQGIGTKRYEADLNLAKALEATPVSRHADLELLRGKLGADGEVWADVFVDSAGRVRRLLLPVHPESERPYGDDKNIPQLVSVDFFDFGKGGE